MSQPLPLPGLLPPPLPPPPPPLGLRKEAVLKWHQLLPRLERIGLTAPEDFDTLAVYVDAFGAWLAAREKLEDHGYTIESKMGTVPSPYLAIRDQAAARMFEAGNRLGLNADNQFAGRMPSFAQWSFGIIGDHDGYYDEPFDPAVPGKGYEPDAYVIVTADGSVQVLK